MAATISPPAVGSGGLLLALSIITGVINSEAVALHIEKRAELLPLRQERGVALLFGRIRRLSSIPDDDNPRKASNISCWNSTRVCCKQTCRPCGPNHSNSTTGKICRHRHRNLTEGINCRKRCEKVVESGRPISTSLPTDLVERSRFCSQPLVTCQQNGKARTEWFLDLLCKRMQEKCGSLESQNRMQGRRLNVPEEERAARERRTVSATLSTDQLFTKAASSILVVSSTSESPPLVSSTSESPPLVSSISKSPAPVPSTSESLVPESSTSESPAPVSSTSESLTRGSTASSSLTDLDTQHIPTVVTHLQPLPKLHSCNTSHGSGKVTNVSCSSNVQLQAKTSEVTTSTSSEMMSNTTLVSLSVLLALVLATSGFVTTTAVKKRRRRRGKLTITPKTHHASPTDRRVHWHAIPQDNTDLVRRHNSTDTVARWLLESSLDEYPRSYSRLSQQMSFDEYSPGTTLTSLTASTMLSSCSNGSSSSPGSLLFVQEHLPCQPADGVNLTDLLESPRHHMFINADGGLLESGELGVRLDIPQNALAGDESCYVCVSIITYPTAFPALQDGGSLFSPIVRLEPRGIAFKQAAQLQLPLSGCVHQKDCCHLRILYNQALPEHEPSWQPLKYNFDSVLGQSANECGKVLNDRFCTVATFFTADFVITREPCLAPYTSLELSIITTANTVDQSPEKGLSEEGKGSSSQRWPQDYGTTRGNGDQPRKERGDDRGHSGFPSGEPEAPLVKALMKKRVAISVFGPAADDHSPNQPRLLRVYCHEDLPDIATRLQKAEVRGRDCFVLLSGPQPMHLEEKENVDVEICDVLADWLVMGPTKQTIPGGLCWDNFACPPHITFPVVRRYEAANDFFFCAFVICIGSMETRLYVSQQCSIPQSLHEIQHEPASMDDLPMRKIWSLDLEHSLAVALNNPPCGIGPDWRLLADRLGYTYLEIRRFEQTTMPTEMLFFDWVQRPGSNVGTFRQALRDIRADALLQVMDDTVVGLTSGYLSLPTYAIQPPGARKPNMFGIPARAVHPVHRVAEITSGKHEPSVVSSASDIAQEIPVTADTNGSCPQTPKQIQPNNRMQNMAQGSHPHPSSLHAIHMAQESEGSMSSATPASTPSSTTPSTATLSSTASSSVKAQHRLSLSPKSLTRAASVISAVRRQASRDSLLSESTAGSDSGVSVLMSSAPTSRRGSGTATTELGLPSLPSPQSPLAVSELARCLKHHQLAQSAGQEQQAEQSEATLTSESQQHFPTTSCHTKLKRSGLLDVAETSV